MKRVGILTHYNVNNQGAQLQLYALHTELKKNVNPVVVRFEKSYEFAEKDAAKRNNIKLSSIPYIINEYIIKRGFGSFIINYKKYAGHKKFISKNFTLVDSNEKLDAVVVGSDEVYSVIEGCNQIMYGHGLNTDKLIGYAPSFGQTTMEILEEKKLKDFVGEGLKKYNLLSARDERTKQMLQELTDCEVTQVCDPVILHDFSNEIKPCKIPKKPYMVVYSYDRNMNNPSEIAAIKAFAKKRGLLTVSAGTYHKWCDKNIACNCLEWLYIIKNAECVVTDTFHGCIASLITEREVAVLTRNINTNKLGALLKATGIEERKITDLESELEVVFQKKMDYKSVNERINNMRKQSKEYLQKAVELIID